MRIERLLEKLEPYHNYENNKMISIEKCRKIVGDGNITDEQLEKIREYLYSLTREIINQSVKDYQNTLIKNKNKIL